MSAPRSRLAVVLVGLSLAASPALGRPKVLPVAVSLNRDAQAATAEVAYILESAVRRSPWQEFVDPVMRFDPDGVQQRQIQKQKADASMAYGKQSYENLMNGLGLESFERAIRTYGNTALWEDFDGLVQAEVMSILVQWADDPGTTKKRIAQLLAIAPQVRFPPDLTSPDLATEVARAHRAIANETRFGLDVSTSPVGARVYVDGVYRGTTPTTVRGLPPAAHYVSLVAPGYQVWQRQVDTQAGATITVTLHRVPRAKPYLTFLGRITREFGTNAEVTSGQVLARAAGADQLFVAGVRRDAGQLTVTIHRIAARDGHVLANGQVVVRADDPAFAHAIDALAVRLLATDRPRGPNGEPMPLQTNLDLTLHKWTDFTPGEVRAVVGIGAAAIFVAGAVTGLVAYSEDQDLRKTPQTDPTVNRRISSTFDTALTADILMGVGLVTGCVWGWLQYGARYDQATDIASPPVLDTTPEKHDNESDPFAGQISSKPSWGLYWLPGPGGGSVGLSGDF